MNFVKSCYKGVCNSVHVAAKYGTMGAKIEIPANQVSVIKSLYPGVDVIFYGEVNTQNVPDGIGELYLNDRETKIFEGLFQNGQVLTGTFINRNGDIFNVYVKDGIVYFKDGIDGISWTGTAKVVSKNGDKFEGEFRYGQRFKGKLVKINGETFDGEFRDDNFFRGKFVNPVGEFEGEFTANGEIWTGIAKFKQPRGDKFKVVEYKDGEEVIKKNGYEFVGFLGELKDDEPWNGTAKVVSKNGDIFEGEIKDGKPFRGKLLHPDGDKFGDKFEGEFKNGKPFRGKLVHYKGNIIFEGEFKDGEPWSGTVKGKHPDGGISEGELKDGQPFRGTFVDPTGETFEGEFKDGQFFRGKLIFPTGETFEGEFKHEQPWSGTGKATLPDGDKFEGELKNGELWNGILVHPNGDKFEVKDGAKRKIKK